MEEEKKQQSHQEPEQPPILEQLKEYAETRLTLAKYKAVEKGTSIVASIVTDLVIVISLVLTFLLATFTLALFLGEVMGAYWKGFGVVALFYLLIAVIVIMAKKSFEKPIINLLISKIFK